MKSSELKNKVFNEIRSSRLQAESLCDKNLELALKNAEFKTIFTKIKTLNFNIAKKEFLNLPTSEDKKELKKLNEEFKTITSKLGFNENSFKPNYSCKKCGDTGLIGENYCDCYYQKMNKLIINNLGIKVDNSHTFSKANFELFQEPEKIKTIYSKIENWCNSLDTTVYKTILISGTTGVGKTYLVDCVCNNLIQKNYIVNYYTAFSLSDLFLKYRTNFSNSNNLDEVLNCDVLIIDDLGSEPNFKNNEEYFYLLFNERLVKNKFTIITTNLLPSQILDRYGERTFSRLVNKRTSTLIKIENSDLRIKK